MTAMAPAAAPIGERAAAAPVATGGTAVEVRLVALVGIGPE